MRRLLSHPFKTGASRSGIRRGNEGGEDEEIVRGRAGPVADGAGAAGGPAVPFRLTAHGRTSATFDNPGHDFPQRIRYVRTGNMMVATISALDGSNAMSWTYRRRP